MMVHAFKLPKAHVRSERAVGMCPESFVFDPLGFAEEGHEEVIKTETKDLKPYIPGLSMAPAALALFVATPAEAAFQAANNAVPSALAAYGHYLGLVLVAGALVSERLTIKPAMTDDEEEFLGNADIVYGIAGILVLYTGYLRVTEYGKGWDFYSHSPLFWAKMLLFSIMGSSSLFPTTKIIQRLVAKRNGEDVAPMSEKLAGRMKTIMNGEILAIASIPLAAATMSRGIFYTEALPWQAGAAPVAAATLFLSVKYLKEALDWKEDENYNLNEK